MRQNDVKHLSERPVIDPRIALAATTADVSAEHRSGPLSGPLMDWGSRRREEAEVIEAERWDGLS